MNYPHRPTAPRAAESRHYTTPQRGLTALDAEPVQQARPLTRRYEVSHLAENGDVMDFRRLAPALPVFEDAFSAFAHGTLISTADGPVAVEDIVPGTYVQTADSGLQPLLWAGSMTIVPGTPGQAPDMAQLSRVTADSFGLARPSPDLVLGPRARLFYRHPVCRTMLGTDAALAPVTAFQDGDSVIRITPVAPVRVYHLGLAGHEVILANGLEVESYHPGRRSEMPLSGELLSLFLALFPHIRRPGEFGPLAYPRVSEETATGLRAA